jgi:hypothetical protein
MAHKNNSKGGGGNSHDRAMARAAGNAPEPSKEPPTAENFAPPQHAFGRSSKEAYFFGMLSLLQGVFPLNTLWRGLITLVLAGLASDFSFHEVPFTEKRAKVVSATIVAVVVLGLMAVGMYQQERREQHEAYLEKLPLCYRADSTILWLRAEDNIFSGKFLGRAKSIDESGMTAVWGEYTKRFADKAPEMEQLSDEMNAKLDRHNVHLNVLAMAMSGNIYVGTIGLERTEQYFTALSHDMGCPAATLEEMQNPAQKP